MTLSVVTSERRYAQLVATLASRPGVTVAAVRKKGLGSRALCVDGRMFAALSSTEQLVVRLEKHRVDTLVSAGHGARFEPFHGAAMNEWLVAGLGREKDWLALAEEALAFVGTRQEAQANDELP
jgi:hypothetical protein